MFGSSRERLTVRMNDPEKIVMSPVDNSDVPFTLINEQGTWNVSPVDSTEVSVVIMDLARHGLDSYGNAIL